MFADRLKLSRVYAMSAAQDRGLSFVQEIPSSSPPFLYPTTFSHFTCSEIGVNRKLQNYPIMIFKCSLDSFQDLHKDIKSKLITCLCSSISSCSSSPGLISSVSSFSLHEKKKRVFSASWVLTSPTKNHIFFFILDYTLVWFEKKKNINK